MDILKLTPFFHHPDTDAWPAAYDSVGGMQIQTWRQAVWLSQAGINQHVMTIGFPGLPKFRTLHPNLTIERMLLPMPLIRSGFSGFVGLTHSWAFATLFTLFRKKSQYAADIVHAHLDGQIPALLVAWIVPRFLHRPLVVTVHCSRLAVYTPHSWLDKLQHRLAKWLESNVVSTASSVIALTHRTASLLSFHARHVAVVPDIVDPLQFAPPSREAIAVFRGRFGLKQQAIGFVGRIAREKGWTHLIPLAKALRDEGYELIIIGDGTQRNELEHEIAKAKLQDCITITGFIPNHEVPLAIAACRLIVMPSEYEEFGGASIEALATGTPVVAFAVGGLQEILSGITPDLLVTQGDTLSLIAKVKAVLSGEYAQSIDPVKLREFVTQCFPPSAMVTEVINLYRRAINNDAANL